MEKEGEILDFWKKERIFEKSVAIRRTQGKKHFVFFEGPPTANGRPGIHHMLARAFKDIICRYKTMRGFLVERKAGWDTHGLPVEIEVEKELGFKSKADIEKYGIAKFNAKCKESVWKYKKEWEDFTDRMGFWIDMKRPYITYTNEYIETLWWILKQTHDKGLLEEDYKIVPWCPRCGTGLSSHEVAQGYEDVTEDSVYVKFKLQDAENTYFLSWTTTPWTLPGNVALAVNPDAEYVKARVGREYYILAENRISVLGDADQVAVVQTYKGKDLVGMRYESLFDFLKNVNPAGIENAFQVLPADFVTLEEGTGIVHTAVMYGEDDFELGKEYNLPEHHLVDERGFFIKDVKPWAGIFVKEADKKIISRLKRDKKLFTTQVYTHSYPFCWRCKTPLLYYARNSWWIRMSRLRDELIKNNRSINWIPSHLKEGRFGQWLAEVKDWAISRHRYWGTPLPIWKCNECKNVEVMGSIEELKSRCVSSGNKYFVLRHGLSQNNVLEIVSSDIKNDSWYLTQEGREQVRNIIPELKKLNISLIYSSDFIRTKETAEIVAKELGIKVIYAQDFREYNMGEFSGKTEKDVHSFFQNELERFERALPSGESWNDLRLRMYRFMQFLENKYRNMNILLIGHGDPLWFLEGLAEGLSNESILESHYIKNGEVRKINFKPISYNDKGEFDLHRPFIDRIRLRCSCGNSMERAPDLVDVWFDSGAMPFAQWHYPFINKEKIDGRGVEPAEAFPADYIAEAVDQTRGWFYTLLSISALLGKGAPYKNVISMSHLLDKNGKKMSKSLGNVVHPQAAMEKYSADALRWFFFTVNSPGDVKLFDETVIKKNALYFLNIFGNSVQFLSQSKGVDAPLLPSTRGKTMLDRWLLTRFIEVRSEVTHRLDVFDVVSAARIIEQFIVEDISHWYIRRIRDRVKTRGVKGKSAASTLRFVLLELSKVLAPFTPFIAERSYKELGGKRKSVHLENWTAVKKKTTTYEQELISRMQAARDIVSAALQQRAVAGIKIRQPMQRLTIRDKELANHEELLELIKEEVNVKEVVVNSALTVDAEIDTKITPELREEGIMREIIRSIQAARKEAGLIQGQKVIIALKTVKEIANIAQKFQKDIMRQTSVRELQLVKKASKKQEVRSLSSVSIEDNPLDIFILL